MHPLPHLRLCVVTSCNRFVHTSFYSKFKLTHWDSVSFYVAPMSWSIFKRLIAEFPNSTSTLDKFNRQLDSSLSHIFVVGWDFRNKGNYCLHWLNEDCTIKYLIIVIWRLAQKVKKVLLSINIFFTHCIYQKM